MNLLLKRISVVFTAIIIVLAIVAVYSFYIEPARLIVHEEDLKIPNWSAKLDGFKVVAVSDIHGGAKFITEKKIRELVETVNRQNPDLIVLLGDYVSQKSKRDEDLKMPSEVIAENLKGLRARYGVYGVVGNHDWWYDEEKVSREFENAGIKILENETARVRVGDETVNVWGIEDYWKKTKVPLEPFEKIPVKENILAITHNPDSLLETPPEIALMFAGHTHGGQFKFPIFGALVLVSDERFTEGFVEVDGRHVFVTTGVGTSGPAVRFRVPPEIAVLRLYAE
ncbi:MAG TPA: metallophosphoesterase [Pyrinomonadaceae bacterium]|nr:metallophosphoesterase [Pyrinomonadaceae bacterium]